MVAKKHRTVKRHDNATRVLERCSTRPLMSAVSLQACLTALRTQEATRDQECAALHFEDVTRWRKPERKGGRAT
jgi:hypothetical protein